MWQKISNGGLREMVQNLTDADAIKMSEAYGTLNYNPIPVNLIKGKNARVWDQAGKEYIDCIGAYSAVSHGHLNPKIVKTVKDQVDNVAVVSRAFNNAEVSLFLHGLVEFCELERACPMNTGAEAVETCVKLARKWGYKKKGVEKDKAEIIVFQDNFHGRTTTIIGFSSELGYKEFFGPYGPGFKIVPFGDIEALKAAITPNTVAILGEPIQAEGGIIMPPKGWMTEVRQLCDKENVLLIWDEIQVGFYRTGKKFAWMNEPAAKPDMIAVGKPLGGGVIAVSAAVGMNHVMEVFEYGDHGSTFGGNPLGSAVALAAMAEFETGGYAERSTELGDKAFAKLRAANHPLIKEIRGQGLLIGIEFKPEVDAKKLGAAFVEHGILTKQTRRNTFRLTPPLTIEEDTLMEAIDRVLKAADSIA